ncbi:MAG: zf-TFIIB domain-containing protein [Dehalococcoidia bacterium]|nr:zf-TFIIB domain-containing protein [Dehalococcoidia bacterium]
MEARVLYCPRDGSRLAEERMHGIPVDRCAACHGSWLDPDELGRLEATVADEEVRRGMIEYAEHPSELPCPVCGRAMQAFNYRAYNLQLDTCEEHGYWLDEHEDRAVLDVIRERRRGLQRAPAAEAAWYAARRGGGGSFTDRVRRFFGR